jgi:hypothetical protein
MCEAAEKLEARGAEQAKMMLDESARLARESLAYALQLSAEARKLTLETARNAAEAFKPRA